MGDDLGVSQAAVSPQEKVLDPQEAAEVKRRQFLASETYTVVEEMRRLLGRVIQAKTMAESQPLLYSVQCYADVARELVNRLR